MALFNPYLSGQEYSYLSETNVILNVGQLLYQQDFDKKKLVRMQKKHYKIIKKGKFHSL